MLPRDRSADLKRIPTLSKQRGDGRSASRRNSFGSIVKSRTVQGVLVLAAGLQGATVVAKHQAGGSQAATASPAALAASMAPVLVSPPVMPAAPEIDTAAADTAQVDSPDAAKAHALAEKYRAKGYAVSPTLAKSIHEAALESGIKPEVAFGLVRTESAFRNGATSHVGAIGLTQLMPKTANWLEPGTSRSDLRNPDTNLRIGFKYLARLMDRYDGNTRLALLAYNRGPGTVDRVLKRGGNPDNGYADMVLRR